MNKEYLSRIWTLISKTESADPEKGPDPQHIPIVIPNNLFILPLRKLTKVRKTRSFYFILVMSKGNFTRSKNMVLLNH